MNVFGGAIAADHIDKAAGDGDTVAVATAAWSSACAILKGELGEDKFGSWIAPARLKRSRGGALVVVTPTGLARDWIRRYAWRRIGELWTQNDPERRALDLKSRLEFEGEDGDGAGALRASLSLVPGAEDALAGKSATGAQPSIAGLAASSRVQSSSQVSGASGAGVSAIGSASPMGVALNAEAVVDSVQTPARVAGLQERFTFDTFVTGPSNEFAVMVAKRVAAWSDGCFNPVFFHGPYGFGKTHLLNAIAWEASRQRPDKKIVYLTAERFTSTFVKALMDRAAPGFKDDLRTADLLLVDDVQFIGGKRTSEEELFHTLAALMSEGRRVVFASDRPANALAELDGRLRSHLGAGLVCGIEVADKTLRLGILERKLALLSRDLGIEGQARSDVMQFLSDRFCDSVRELEGALNTLAARAGERLSKLTLDEAQAFLRPHMRGGEKRITVDEIQKVVAEHFKLKQADLLSERRTRAVARPRHVAMYLAKQLTTRSYPDIGRRFGGRDHTTVLHAVKRIEELKATEPGLATDLEAITRKLKD
jgi:chromosomal replication initiator protein